METLQKENDYLRKELRTLIIEKNRLEDQLYRAFRKCLNSKKRKICQLKSELDILKNDKNNNQSKHAKRKKVVVVVSSDDEDTTGHDRHDDSDGTDIDEDVQYEGGDTSISPVMSTEHTPHSSPNKQTNLQVKESLATTSTSASEDASKNVRVQPQSTKGREQEDSDSGEDCFPLPKSIRKRREALSQANEATSKTSKAVALGSVAPMAVGILGTWPGTTKSDQQGSSTTSENAGAVNSQSTNLNTTSESSFVDLEYDMDDLTKHL